MCFALEAINKEIVIRNNKSSVMAVKAKRWAE